MLYQLRAPIVRNAAPVDGWLMWRLYPLLKWFFAVLLVGLVISVGANVLTALMQESGFRLATQLKDFLRVRFLWIILFFLILAELTLWARRDWYDHQARSNFSILTPTEKLQPQDLGFQVLKPGRQPDPHYRPFYVASTYIPRRMAPYESIAEEVPHPEYTEETLAQSLRQGRGFLLLGQPLDGKSRTLYDIVRRMEGYEIIMPLRGGSVPPDDAFRVLDGRRAILLLEDVNDYAGARIDLLEFCRKVGQHAQSWVLAATCRDGPELGVVREAVGTSLRRFYEGIPLKLRLLCTTAEDKERLARSIGRNWDRRTSDLFPTLGSITMAKPLEAMRQRFQALPAEQKDTLRALKLLGAAGILPFTHARLQTVLESLFQRRLHLGDCLESLTGHAFLRRPARQDPLQPEPAYLLDAVEYTEGRSPEDDFPILEDLLRGLNDVEGILYIGTTYWLTLKNHQRALACLDTVIHFRPEHPEALVNKGAILSDLGRHSDAIDALDQALLLKADSFEALVNKGNSLASLGRYTEALACFDQALRLAPELFEAWYNKGNALASLRRYEDALAAYDEALRLHYDFPLAWANKGNALASLRRYEDALAAYDEALRLGSDTFEGWYNKGNVLTSLGRHTEALACFGEALRLRPDSQEAWLNKGNALGRLGREGDAVDAYGQALQLRPNNPEAWTNKGIALGNLGNYAEALTAFEEALQFSPDLLEASLNKGIALGNLGRSAEALAAFEQALHQRPYYPEAWVNKAIALGRLGRHGEAIDWLCLGLRERERFSDGGWAIQEALQNFGISPEQCGQGPTAPAQA